MRQIIILCILFLGCNFSRENKIKGQWIILEMYLHNEVLIPDTTLLWARQPDLFIENSEKMWVSDYNEKQRMLTKYRIYSVGTLEYIEVYDTCTILEKGTFTFHTFRDIDIFNKHKKSMYMEIYNDTFYLIARKNMD